MAPVSGLPPAPIPCVISSPIWMVRAPLAWASDLMSVLTQMNVTPGTARAFIIRMMALEPPPPTPMAQILAGVSWKLGRRG